MGDRLAKALKWADVSVQDMADYLGVTRQTVGNYLSGRTEMTRGSRRLWALRCGLPLEWIETGQVTENGGGNGGESLTGASPSTGAEVVDFPRRMAA